MSDFNVEPCRSCAAPVIWAVDEKGAKLPIDAEPVADGALQLEWRGGPLPLARKVSVKLAFGRRNLRRSHFKSCPDAGSWRRQGKRRTAS